MYVCGHSNAPDLLISDVGWFHFLGPRHGLRDPAVHRNGRGTCKNSTVIKSNNQVNTQATAKRSSSAVDDGPRLQPCRVEKLDFTWAKLRLQRADSDDQAHLRCILKRAMETGRISEDDLVQFIDYDEDARDSASEALPTMTTLSLCFCSETPTMTTVTTLTAGRLEKTNTTHPSRSQSSNAAPRRRSTCRVLEWRR